MKAPKQAREQAEQLFHLCLVEGLLDEERGIKVLQGIVGTKPRGYLGILWHFRRLVEQYRDARAAKVETARPLPDDMRARLSADLARVYGGGLAVSFSEDAALIGGMRIRVGSDVYDGSVRGRLAALERSF